jgi:hypothetical protein
MRCRPDLHVAVHSPCPAQVQRPNRKDRLACGWRSVVIHERIIPTPALPRSGSKGQRRWRSPSQPGIPGSPRAVSFAPIFYHLDSALSSIFPEWIRSSSMSSSGRTAPSRRGGCSQGRVSSGANGRPGGEGFQAVSTQVCWDRQRTLAGQPPGTSRWPAPQVSHSNKPA